MLPVYLRINPHTGSNVKRNATEQMDSYDKSHNSSHSSSNTDRYTTHHHINNHRITHHTYNRHRRRHHHQNAQRIWQSLPHIDPDIPSLMMTPKIMPKIPFLQSENESPQWAWTAGKTSHDRFLVSSSKMPQGMLPLQSENRYYHAISMVQTPRIIQSVAEAKNDKTQWAMDETLNRQQQPSIKTQRNIGAQPPIELENQRIMSTEYKPIQWHDIPTINIPEFIPGIPSSYDKKTKQSRKQQAHRHRKMHLIKKPKSIPNIPLNPSLNHKIKQLVQPPDYYDGISSIKLGIANTPPLQTENQHIVANRQHIVEHSVKKVTASTRHTYSSINIIKNIPIRVQPTQSKYDWTPHFTSLKSWKIIDKPTSVSNVPQKPPTYWQTPTYDHTDFKAPIISSHPFSQVWQKPSIAATKPAAKWNKLLVKTGVASTVPLIDKTIEVPITSRKSVFNYRSPIRKKSFSSNLFTIHSQSHGEFKWYR